MDGVDAAPGDVDGVVPEVWLVTWMVVLLGLAKFHLCRTLPRGSIAVVGVGLGGLDAGVAGEVGDDVNGLPEVSAVVLMLVWPDLAPPPLSAGSHSLGS